MQQIPLFRTERIAAQLYEIGTSLNILDLNAFLPFCVLQLRLKNRK